MSLAAFVRRFASLALTAAAVVTITSAAGPPVGLLARNVHAADEAVAPCGDVNCNGEVSASDALAVLRRAVGIDNAVTCPEDCPANLEAAVGANQSAEAAVCGDFDCGGTVAASDALAILRAAVGLAVGNLRCDCAGPTTTVPPPTTTTLPTGSCGDNLVNQTAEQCDGEDDDNCRGLCRFDCTCPPAECGNGIKEIGEPCDGDDLAGQTCVTLGFDSGTVTCTPGCKGFDSDACVLTAIPPDPATTASPIDPTAPTNIDEAVAFLYRGNPRVQVGLTREVIDAERVAVICGRVLDEDGAPLAGVEVSVFEHPELGRTLSRTDGGYDLVVNGGGLLTLSYLKDGKLPAQRALKTPWRDYVTAPDVMLVPVDANTTAVEPMAAEMQVHQGGTVTDADGARTATILFPPATSAEMVMPDGSTQALGNLTVRATEYTVGADGPLQMPGELPGTSAYTYAVEYSVDEAMAAGASSVTFDQPVPFYVENFLGFPVGSLVPAGSYDREQGRWIPEESGRVIKILAVNGGAAELDVTGDDVTDTGAALDDLGITTAELQKLATLYAPGQELWRVAATHLTPWDCNWPYGPPPDACSPSGCGQPPPKPKPEDKPPKGKERCKGKGSIIECQTQVLGEEIPVAATPFTLNYRSNRFPGRKAAYTLNTRLSGEGPLPASLQTIFLEIRVGGRIFKEAFAAAPNLVDTFTWDGNDVYGRALQGSQPVLVRIGYGYAVQYYATRGEVQGSFNRFASMPTYITAGPGFSSQEARTTTPPVILWEDFETSLGAWDARGLGMGGWSIDVHHAYDPNRRRLYLGSGETREVDAVSLLQIETVARVRDGFSASDLDVTEEGDVLVADFLNQSIHRMAEDGTITRFAGNGFPCLTATSPCGDGGPANQAQLREPTSVAVGPDGSVYIADFNNWRIRRVGPDGIITTVAGDGTDCFSTGPCGDGGPALQAKLRPQRIAVGPDGTIYFFDYTTQRLRRVSPDGLVTSVSGEAVFCGQIPKTCGEGEPVSKAGIVASDLAVASDGSIYVTSATNRVLRIGVDGILERVAGDGTACLNSQSPCGDGADAKLAQLREPRGISLGPDGSIYFADSDNNRIRRIGPDGIITTVAGRGTSGVVSGDGGPASAAVIPIPTSVAVAEDGSVYLASVGVRKAAPVLPRFDGGSILLASEDGGEAYVFDAVGRHRRTVHTLTGAVLYEFEYDTAGRLTAITDGDGNITVIERNGSGVATGIVSQGGVRTALTIGVNGLLANVSNPEGETTTLTYHTGDADGLLKTYADPKGQLYQFTYDADGRLVSDADPANGTTLLARTALSDDSYSVDMRSAEGLVTTYTLEDLPNGDARRVRTDPSGAQTENLVREDGTNTVTFPDGTVAETTLGPDPRFGMQAPVATQITLTLPGKSPMVRTAARTAVLADPENPFSLVSQTDTVSFNGETYTTTFDATTNRSTRSTPGGRQSVMTVDEQGRPTSATPVGSSALVAWERDEFGRLTEIAQNGQSWSYEYAHPANPFRVSAKADALGRAIEFEFDDAQRVTETRRPDGQAIRFEYDANGNRTHVVLPGGADHTLEYSATDFEVEYTPAGNVVGYARALDDDDRVTGIALPSGATQTVSYDAFGRPTGVSTAESTTTVEYAPGDLTNRPAVISRTFGPATQDLTFTHAGEIVEGVAFDGLAEGVYAYTYDENARLTSINLTSGADESSVLFAYDNDSLITTLGPFTVTRGVTSGLPSRYSDGTGIYDLTFDVRRRVASRSVQVNGNDLYEEQLSYDLAGRIVQRIETVDGVQSTYTYTYDDNGWLTRVERNGTTAEEYAYDVRGNRTSRKLGGGAAELSTYDLQDRQTARGATSYQFDVDGFLAQRGSDSFDFGARADLLDATVGGQTVSYGYDGFGRRTARTVDGATAHYLYGNPEHDGQLTASRSGSGVLTTYIYDDNARLMALERGGNLYYVASDLLGTPKLVVDDTGAVMKELTWDSFGNLTDDSNPAFDLAIGFAGGLRDGLTGFVRFGVRDYEPASGRWTTRDAAGFDTRQLNLFAYVGNDPIDKRDASGLFSAGGSAYDGVGGGFKLGLTGEGISFCAEIGLGFGDSFELDPTGGLDEEGVSLDASGQLKAGPLGSVEFGGSFKECREIELKLKGCTLGLCEEHLFNKKDQWERKRKAEGDPKDVKNLLSGFKKGLGWAAEGKIAANFCTAGKW